MRRLRLPSGLGRRRRALAIGGVALAGAGGIVALLRWRLWSGSVPMPATPALADWFDPAALERGRDYRRGIWAMAMASVPVAPAAAVAVALTGRRWRPVVARLASGQAWRAGALVGGGLAVTLALAALPLVAARFAWGRSYGLVTQGTGPWLLDVGKGAGIQVIVLGLVGGGLAVLLRRAPRLWWAGLGLVIAGLVYALSLLSPVVIEPLFQRTEPLRDPALSAQVLDLAERAGVEARDVLVNDASRRTTVANAYVSGLGASRHVVLYDNLLRDFPPEQVRFVVAHELAHVARRHVLKGTTWGAALALPACLALFALVGLRTGFGPIAAGSSGVADGGEGMSLLLRRLALVAAGATVLSAASAPLGNWVSRAYEREAEWTALRLTADGDAAIGLQQGFVRRSLSVPDPPAWVRVWFGSHPTPLERIGLALQAPPRPEP